MFRKLMLGAVAAIGLGFATQGATAGEPPFVPGGYGGYGGFGGGYGGGLYPPRVDYDYVVFVAHRHRDHWHWERYGRYETRREADRVERFLERQGHRVRIEEVRDRRR